MGNFIYANGTVWKSIEEANLEKIDPDQTYIGPIPVVQRESLSGGEILQSTSEGQDQLRINDRDRELFFILLAQRFLTLELIAYRFEPKLLTRPKSDLYKSGLYRRVIRFVRAGYFRTGKLNGKVVYTLSQKGLGEINNPDNLPLPSDLDKITTAHDLVCSEIRFYLEACGGRDWFSDLQLRAIGGKDDPGVFRKIPDGAMKYNGLFVFVEVEFSQKARDRYDLIYRRYSRAGGPNRVLYIYRQRSDVEYLMSLTGSSRRFAFFPYLTPLPPINEWLGLLGNRTPLPLQGFLGL